jgi:cell fate (sporulation/competence/biofilm development) regulator YlbF (YheA/YmcA/DUF963 family)
VRPRLGCGVLLMSSETRSIAIQVFAAPSVSCRPGVTWEAATDFLRKRLQHRFGEAAEVEHIEMFTPRSFEFPDVLDALGRWGFAHRPCWWPDREPGRQALGEQDRRGARRIAAIGSEAIVNDIDERRRLDGSELDGCGYGERSVSRTRRRSFASVRRFEAAQEAFMADRPLRARLDDLQARAQQLRVARMWDGTDAMQEEALQQELDSLADVPTLRDFFAAQEELRALLQGVTKKITEEIGVDYGAACSPAGGCC